MAKNPNKKNRSKKIVGIWLVLMFLFMTELFFYAWCRVQYIQEGYDITKANAQQDKLLALQQNLKIELARLKSPQRIENIAREQLGLIAPSIEQIIIMPLPFLEPDKHQGSS